MSCLFFFMFSLMHGGPVWFGYGLGEEWYEQAGSDGSSRQRWFLYLLAASFCRTEFQKRRTGNLQRLRNYYEIQQHLPAEKSVDFLPWGLLTFAGNPVICAVERRFPHPESGKHYRRILKRGLCVWWLRSALRSSRVRFA